MATRRGWAPTGRWDADDPADEPLLRVRGPGDLVQVIPYLLGFRPAESLVVVGLAGARVVVTVRVDLADLADLADLGDVAGLDPEVAGASGEGALGVLATTLSAMAAGGADELIGVVFDDRAVPDPTAAPDPLPWHGLERALQAEAARLGATVSDALLVSGGRRWSYCCAGSDCCPSDGIVLDDESSAVPAAAAYAGLVALPDRDTLAAVLDPLPADERDPMLPALVAAEEGHRAAADGGRARRSATRALFAAVRRVDGPAGIAELTDDDLVWLGAALATTTLRDAVWLAVDGGRLDGRDLWRWLGRHLPGHYAAAPLFLFGWASWRVGNGALAGIAGERALDADPRYTAADLLLAVVSSGIDPRQMPRIRQRSA